MKFLRVYKELEVTNGEFLAALIQLGYYAAESDNPLLYRYVNDAFDSVVLIPRKPLDEYILKSFTAGYSNQLYWKGIIKHTDDLVKMIEKERLRKKREEKKAAALQIA
jgi:hypothetical protein